MTQFIREHFIWFCREWWINIETFAICISTHDPCSCRYMPSCNPLNQSSTRNASSSIIGVSASLNHRWVICKPTSRPWSHQKAIVSLYSSFENIALSIATNRENPLTQHLSIQQKASKGKGFNQTDWIPFVFKEVRTRFERVYTVLQTVD